MNEQYFGTRHTDFSSVLIQDITVDVPTETCNTERPSFFSEIMDFGIPAAEARVDVIQCTSDQYVRDCGMEPPPPGMGIAGENSKAVLESSLLSEGINRFKNDDFTNSLALLNTVTQLNSNCVEARDYRELILKKPGMDNRNQLAVKSMISRPKENALAVLFDSVRQSLLKSIQTLFSAGARTWHLCKQALASFLG